MNKKSSIRLGPGAPSLILIFVILSLSILAMLSLMTARNDLRLSERSAQAAEKVYQLREKAQERRAKVETLLRESGEAGLAAALNGDPSLEGMVYSDGTLRWAETDGTRTLTCALEIQNGSARWTAQRLSTNIGDNSAEERETNAKLALADRMLERQEALDAMLSRCAAAAPDWNAYLALIADALPNEPMADGVRLEGDRLAWIEEDGTYRYACEVIIHPLDSERRSDFAGTPVLLDDNTGEEEFFD